MRKAKFCDDVEDIGGDRGNIFYEASRFSPECAG
jgi:hypothetical protein